MSRSRTRYFIPVLAALISTAAGAAFAGDTNTDRQDSNSSGACAGLPNQDYLQQALTAAYNGGNGNGGFGLHMWATVVNRDGVVCAVAFTGTNRGSQWPGSRVISAQKANTANAFSLPGLALSTANIYAAVQPGGSLFGLQHSNPVDTETAYRGPASSFGQSDDPMVGRRIGGVNVFGGGLALYNSQKKLVGAIGVSGDTSCADHNIAWRTRNNLRLDFVPGGVSNGGKDDNINYQGHVQVPSLANDFSHPVCAIAGDDSVVDISAHLPPVRQKP
jgi:uncharacterized protein GlcG (DUF336 family)